jgi:mannose-6-phosphate isomerase
MISNNFSTDTEENVRPWGRYDILETSEYHQVKRITILPGQRNSYQTHEKRTEHWIVIKGICHSVLNGVEKNHKAGSVVQIPVGMKHRFGNPNDEPCELIEVQTGTYFGEDDIVRLEDDYSRS